MEEPKQKEWIKFSTEHQKPAWTFPGACYYCFCHPRKWIEEELLAGWFATHSLHTRMHFKVQRSLVLPLLGLKITWSLIHLPKLGTRRWWLLRHFLNYSFCPFRFLPPIPITHVLPFTVQYPHSWFGTVQWPNYLANLKGPRRNRFDENSRCSTSTCRHWHSWTRRSREKGIPHPIDNAPCGSTLPQLQCNWN